jgi:hypothetical protein
MYDRNPRWVAVVICCVLSGVALAPDSAYATRFRYPVLIQVTHNTVGDVQDPGLRMEPPQRVSFISDGDVLGPGTEPGHREVFQYDLDTNSLAQLTDSAPGESYAPSRSTDVKQTARPEFTAFVSTGDLDPSVGNADGNPEIFIRIQDSGVIHQITDTADPVVNGEPYPSDSGRCIVFSSTGDINDNTGDTDPNLPAPEGGAHSNADGSQEVFLVQMDHDLFPEPGTFTQLSDGPAGTTSSGPVIGGFYYPRQCNSTFYQSDQQQAPGGHTGYNEIYEYVRNNGRTNVLSAQEIPFPDQYPPPGTYLDVAMSSASNFARGPFAVFVTPTDVWNNGNSGLNMFRFRSFHPRMTQYTPVEPPEEVRNPVISDGGRWIAFESDADLIGRLKHKSATPVNPYGNFEIWRMQKRRKIRQITDSPLNCDNTQPSINDKGLNVAFRSTCDLVPGHNPNNVPQIFLYLQVKGTDPLACFKGGCSCLVSEGCCNVANGCYRSIRGRALRVPKKNCLARDKCE